MQTVETTTSSPNSTNAVFGAVNVCGRTQKQQEKVEAKLLKQGSLWGRFEILHHYVFTRKEFNQVRRAQGIILQHKEKRIKLVNALLRQPFCS